MKFKKGDMVRHVRNGNDYPFVDSRYDVGEIAIVVQPALGDADNFRVSKLDGQRSRYTVTNNWELAKETEKMTFKKGDKVRRIKSDNDRDRVNIHYDIDEVVTATHSSQGDSFRVCKPDGTMNFFTVNENWELVKETEMKVETAELQFIREDCGRRYFIPGKDNDVMSTQYKTPELLYAYLLRSGNIAPANPLEKALAELRKLNSMAFLAEHDKNQIKALMRTLYAEATE